MLHNLQRVDEELQSSAAHVPPPVPPRSNPIASGAAAADAAAAAADDDDDNDDNGCASDDDHYLELQDDDQYESGDVLGSMRRRNVLPGQKSMPESALPPAVMPRKQSCPDAAITTCTRRPPKPPLQTHAETDRPTDTVRLKTTDRPQVAARKK